MTTMRHHWRSRCWSPPDFFERLRREGEIECIEELIRSFTYFTSARLQLLSDARALTEREARSELLSLRDSCRQVGAGRMAFLCREIEKCGLNPETEGFCDLMEALREEGNGVLHDMRVYAIGLKSHAMSTPACSTRRATASALSGAETPNNLIPLMAIAELRQRIWRAVHSPGLMPIEISAKKV
jgi:hypothetical protein